MPDGVRQIEICSESGLIAGPHCPNRRLEYTSGAASPLAACPLHNDTLVRTAWRRQMEPQRTERRPAIASPRTGERYMFDPGIEAGFQNLALEASGVGGLDECSLAGQRPGSGPGPSGSVRRSPWVYWPLERGRVVVKMVGLTEGRETARDQASIIVH